jgi:GAF domain-containing protein
MPSDERALARILKHLRAGRAENGRYAVAVHRVVDAARAMFEADGAGLLLVDGEDLVCVATTDAATRGFEDAQVELARGPCRDAIASGTVVAASNIAAVEAWSGLAAQDRAHRVRAVLSAPVGIGAETVGSLCVTARLVRRWSQADQATITAYAAVVGGLLEAEIGLEDRGETVEQLEHALVGRVLIEQAKGVLMARHGVEAGDAFQDLRRQARSERRKITEVAREVVATTAPGQGTGDLDERLLLLASVTDAALANTDLDGLLADLLERLSDVLAVDAASVLLLTDDGRDLAQAAAVGLPKGLPSSALIPVGSGPAGLVAASRDPVLIEDLDELEVVRPALRQAKLRAWVGAPLVARGRLVGVIEVGTREPDRLGPEILELLELVGERVALAIEHVRRFERERRIRQASVAAEERAQLLDQFTGVLATAGDDAAMLQGLARLAVPRLADLCLIALVEQVEGAPAFRPMARAVGPGVDQAALDALADRYRLDLDSDDPVARVVASGQAVVLAEVTDTMRAADAADAEHLRLRRALGIRSGLLVPLVGGDRVCGLMIVASIDPDRRYGDDDLAIFSDLAQRAAVALGAGARSP